MFAFFTDWGNGQRVFFLVGFVIFILCFLGFIGAKNKVARKPNELFIGLLFLGLGTLISMTSESGRRDTKEAKHALEQYEWEVLDAGHTSQVQIGDCIVDLRRVKLDGNNSLFAIGLEPQAQRLDVVYPKVVELCL